MITQSQKYKPIKCWNCGQSHHLRDCPTVTPEKGGDILKLTVATIKTSTNHKVSLETGQSTALTFPLVLSEQQRAHSQLCNLLLEVASSLDELGLYIVGDSAIVYLLSSDFI
jgi:hypothetical protein